MNFEKLLERKAFKIISIVLVVATITGLTVSTLADEPYNAFDYDWWWDTVPVQNGYMVDRVVNGADLGVSGGLKNPGDVFVFDETQEVFIADTGNNRIVITDLNFGKENTVVLSSFKYGDDYKDDAQKAGTITTLNRPEGLHVMYMNGVKRLYIADHDNERVLALYQTENGDYEVWKEYLRPSSNLYDQSISFRPKKVVVDNAGIVYICIKSITRGAVMFGEDGSFSGYYGANRVERNFNATLNYFLKFVLTREQMANRVKPVPVEFSNFDIDADHFIYTVTDAKSARLDVLKKLDPAGRNVFEQQGYDEFIWGAVHAPYVNGREYRSAIIDVSVDAKGNIYLMDYTSGKVFQYDYEGALMFIFGGKGEQKGLFNTPSAIESYNGKVYVLDSVKNSLTIYKLTEFGALVDEAMALHNRGLYVESKEPWEDILMRDANYFMAYVGMGNSLLSLGEFKESMDYFYKHSGGGYNRAFKDYRIDFIRRNFDVFTAAAVVLIVIAAGGNIAVKRMRKNKPAEKEE